MSGGVQAVGEFPGVPPEGAGEVTVTLLASDEVMPGVVSLPHGFGHNRKGIRMATASTHAGVSCNDVTDAAYLDELSGNAAINGVPVTLSAIA